MTFCGFSSICYNGIIYKVIPYQQKEIKQIFLVEYEKIKWKKEFKREWRDLAFQQLVIIYIYLTDINDWICMFNKSFFYLYNKKKQQIINFSIFQCHNLKIIYIIYFLINKA